MLFSYGKKKTIENRIHILSKKEKKRNEGRTYRQQPPHMCCNSCCCCSSCLTYLSGSKVDGFLEERKNYIYISTAYVRTSVIRLAKLSHTIVTANNKKQKSLTTFYRRTINVFYFTQHKKHSTHSVKTCSHTHNYPSVYHRGRG